MDSFQQIGIAIIFGFIIYLVYFYYNKYTNRQKENFEVKGGSKTDEILSKLTSSVASQHDILLISKYRNKYEAIIENNKKYLKINMIQIMMQIDPSNDSMTDANLKMFNDFNTLKTSYDNMATILNYVDESN
jgi:ABC-type transport system involved in cytochrome bd biosynthesis fused ATPase/permease subunit